MSPLRPCMEHEAHIIGNPRVMRMTSESGGGAGSSIAGSSIPMVSCSLPSAHHRSFAVRGQIGKERRDKQPVREASNG